jgi:hypothetical protein
MSLIILFHYVNIIIILIINTQYHMIISCMCAQSWHAPETKNHFVPKKNSNPCWVDK